MTRAGTVSRVSDDYTVIDSGETAHGWSWEVGVTASGLVVRAGAIRLLIEDEQRDRFAGAVARAVTPGHGEHIVTDLNAHRRHGCPTCLQAVTPPATCPGGC